MQELLFVLEFAIGLIAIVKGADWLTDGAASIAHHFGIPTIVVGLTIVAVGSSAPEFVVSVVSAIKGNADMALGNVVGSNIFNILGIVGITAMVAPIVIDRRNMMYDVPFIVLSSLFVAITAFDSILSPSDGTAAPPVDSISRSDGLLMLCTFLVFMSYTLSIAQNSQQSSSLRDTAPVLLTMQLKVAISVSCVIETPSYAAPLISFLPSVTFSASNPNVSPILSLISCSEFAT